MMEKLDVLKPSWYDRFQCKGGDCSYNCCQCWEISMSREKYRNWRKKKVVGRDAWDKTIEIYSPDKKTESNYAKFILDEENKCPMLTEEGLCQAQKKYGYTILSNTCQSFPRQSHRYLDQVECSMSLGCEKVLELLMEEKDGVLLNNEKKTFPPKFGYGSYVNQNKKRQRPVLKYYYDIQTLFIILLQLEEISLEDRLLLLGMAMRRIDELEAEERCSDIPVYIDQFLKELEQGEVLGMLQGIKVDNTLSVYYSVLTGLIYLNGDDPYYSRVMECICKRLNLDANAVLNNTSEDNYSFKIEKELYHNCKDQFKEWIQGKEYFLENVMVTYMFYANIPFRDMEKSLWENYLYFIWVYSMVKVSLSTYLEAGSTEEDMIHCCSVFFRKLGHNRSLFNKVIQDFNNHGNSLAHLAVLLKSC
ncbi:flagellin lysine-N-methylase [Lacrimispora sp. JR3]|uniref:flagellin lysine-N-methylase n=1 Tax=Lacrimispora sinapis TaxID=3111456 RepID=UPI0037492D72